MTFACYENHIARFCRLDTCLNGALPVRFPAVSLVFETMFQFLDGVLVLTDTSNARQNLIDDVSGLFGSRIVGCDNG